MRSPIVLQGVQLTLGETLLRELYLPHGCFAKHRDNPGFWQALAASRVVQVEMLVRAEQKRANRDG